MSDKHRILDAIIQGSAVELFHANDIAVAPVARAPKLPPLARDCHSGLIGFAGASFTGTLLVVVPDDVFLLLRHPGPRPYRASDWVREAANQLLGRLKSRLHPFHVTFQVGLPSSPKLEEYQRLGDQGTTLGVYPFRTIRADILVVVNGRIDYSAFAYSGGVPSPTEGDILWF